LKQLWLRAQRQLQLPDHQACHSGIATDLVWLYSNPCLGQAHTVPRAAGRGSALSGARGGGGGEFSDEDKVENSRGDAKLRDSIC